MNRRDFLWTTAAATAVASDILATPSDRQSFATRGVVLYPFDLTLADWPQRAARAGLNTIALHAALRLDVLVDFVQSDAGAQFLDRCRQVGVQVEYELHAMGDLLSREYFLQDATLFRTDASGERNKDVNCCPSHPRALEIIAERAVHYSRLLRPTTHRYFFWPDDAADWCQCEKCRGLSASEQALLVEHAILAAIRDHVDPVATLCHLAYGPTLEPPRHVLPQPGIFLEFAPIRRRHDRAFESQRDLPAVDRLEMLDAGLDVFPRETAQVLEYWLDVSRISGWRRPAQKMAWYPEVFEADLESYRRRGIRHVTSFACFIDADYVARHGDPQPQLDEYGARLSGR